MPEGEVRVRLAVDVEAVRVGNTRASRFAAVSQTRMSPSAGISTSPTWAFVVASGRAGGTGCGSPAPPRSRPAAGFGSALISEAAAGFSSRLSDGVTRRRGGCDVAGEQQQPDEPGDLLVPGRSPSTSVRSNLLVRSWPALAGGCAQDHNPEQSARPRLPRRPSPSPASHAE